MTAHVSRTARIAHDEDAASVETALRIRLDIHALDILDRKRAAVDGDGIRRTLPACLRAFVRQKAMTAGTCLDVEAMPRHINRTFNVAVPVDRPELIVPRRSDGLIRRLYLKLDVAMEGIVPLAVVNTLAFPICLGIVRIEIAFGNLLLNRFARQRSCIFGLYMSAPV